MEACLYACLAFPPSSLLCNSSCVPLLPRSPPTCLLFRLSCLLQCRLPLLTTAEKSQQTAIQIAVKNNTGVYYFAMQFPFYMGFASTGYVTDKKEFIGLWKVLAFPTFGTGV